MRRCMPTGAVGLTLGVDTHKDIHLALDGVGIESTGSFGAGLARFLRHERCSQAQQQASTKTPTARWK